VSEQGRVEACEVKHLVLADFDEGAANQLDQVGFAAEAHLLQPAQLAQRLSAGAGVVQSEPSDCADPLGWPVVRGCVGSLFLAEA